MAQARRALVTAFLLLGGGQTLGAAPPTGTVPPPMSPGFFSAYLAEELSHVVYGPVLTEAQLLVSGPIGNRFFVHFWTSPSVSGGRCYIDTIDREAAAPRFPSWRWGGSCSRGPARPLPPRILAAHPFQ